MRGSDERAGSLFSYVDLEDRIPARHPLRKILVIVNAALKALDAEFAGLYAPDGRPSIPPERLLRAALIQDAVLNPVGDPADGAVAVQPAFSLVRRARASTRPYGCRRCSRRTATDC
jgi:hypothetical protein